jgi:predicted nucleic acid-binding protein
VGLDRASGWALLAAQPSCFLNLLRSLRANAAFEIVPPDPDLFERGIDLFARRADKAWSLTDCISFVVMTERGLTEALTGDHHFEQAGFLALLRSP